MGHPSDHFNEMNKHIIFPAAFIIPCGLLLSGVVTIILLVTAWMGGELVYRYGVGVMIRPATATTDERRYTKAA